jgi:hypothetical protein
VKTDKRMELPLLTTAVVEASGQLHTPAALPPGKGPTVPIPYGPGVLHSGCGRCGEWNISG